MIPWVHVSVSGARRSFASRSPSLRYFASAALILTVPGTVALPTSAHAQTRAPTGTGGASRIIIADPARLGTQPQARTIPNVIGMTTKQAIDSLRWTRMGIVQRDSATSSVAAGLVVDQRPRAGSPTGTARSVTLFVATQSNKPRGPLVNWSRLVEGMVSGIVAPTKPPPSRADTNVVSGPVPTEVPTQPGGDSITVPGTRVQDRTRVPSLFNNTPSMVAASLRKNRLRQGSTSRDYSDEIPAGRVYRQEPPATREVPTFTSVDVWYSVGPHPATDVIKVPRVVGLLLSAASDSLGRAGLRTGHVDYLTRPGAEGAVVHQSPAEGQPGHRNDAIDLTITNPPTQVAVPSVTGLARTAAQDKLQLAGFGVGRITLVVMPRNDTVIVSQDPAPPAMADSGTLVDLVENRPPELRRVPVPNLIGKSLAEADATLRQDNLVLGEVLRPAVNLLDRVINQNPRGGVTVFMHTPVTIALGTSTPDQPTPTAIVPAVVSFSLDSARHALAAAGFTQLAISGGGEMLTSSSVVESQNPVAGSLAAPSTLISLVARSALSPLPVPNLVGMHPEDARTAAEIDGLRMIVIDTLRQLRIDDAVVRQEPLAGVARRPDSSVEVDIGIPFMPPIGAGLIGLAVVAGTGGAAVKKWRTKPRTPEPQASDIVFKPVASERTLPVLESDGQDTLIETSLTLRFGQDTEAPVLELPGNSLIRSEEPANV